MFGENLHGSIGLKKKDAGVHIHHQKGIFSVQIFFLCVFNVHTVFDCILDENMGWSEQK